MADESEWSCPVCRDDQEDVAYMSPCLHQFCLGCALRWAWQKPNCPLCRSATTAVLFSVLSDDDYLTFNVPGPAEPSPEERQDEQGAAGLQRGALVGGFPLEVWVDFFRSHPHNIRPLLPWLRREIGVLFGDQWWQVALGEAEILGQLFLFGLDEEMLVRQLQSCLLENTRTFIRQLIATAVRLCGREIRRHLGQQDPRDAGWEDDSPAASASPTASRRGTPDSSLASSSSPPDEEEEAGTSAAALRGRPGRPPSAPVPAEQEQPQEEPGEVAGVAGPSAQGCRRRPSAPGRGRGRSGARSRRAPKRRAPGPQDSPQPRKRPQEEPGEVAGMAGPSAQGCRRSPSAPGRGRGRSGARSRRAPKRRAPGPQDSPQPRKRPQEEPGEVAGMAGPSAQGCRRSPSAPGRGRDRSPGRPRRAPKRRAPGPLDSPQPCKRPLRRRH